MRRTHKILTIILLIIIVGGLSISCGSINKKLINSTSESSIIDNGNLMSDLATIFIYSILEPDDNEQYSYVTTALLSLLGVQKNDTEYTIVYNDSFGNLISCCKIDNIVYSAVTVDNNITKLAINNYYVQIDKVPVLPKYDTQNLYITLDEAIEIVTLDNGTTKDYAVSLFSNYDFFNGSYCYDICYDLGDDFYSYKVDCQSGKIIQKDINNVTSFTDIPDLISFTDCLTSVCSELGIQNKDVDVGRCKLINYYGKYVYDLSFDFSDNNYKYLVMATNGKILYNNAIADSPINSPESIDIAKDMVLKHSGADIDKNQLTLDYHILNGYKIYSIQFIDNDISYHYDIRADIMAINYVDIDY